MECTVKYCHPKKGYAGNQLMYYPTLEKNKDFFHKSGLLKQKRESICHVNSNMSLVKIYFF